MSGIECKKGTGFLDFDLARSCKEELEQKHKKPFHIAVSEVGMWSNLYVREGLQENCATDAVFKDFMGDNEAAARDCANSLMVLAGKPHVTIRALVNRIFSDHWKVELMKKK